MPPSSVTARPGSRPGSLPASVRVPRRLPRRRGSGLPTPRRTRGRRRRSGLAFRSSSSLPYVDVVGVCPEQSRESNDQRRLEGVEIEVGGATQLDSLTVRRVDGVLDVFVAALPALFVEADPVGIRRIADEVVERSRPAARAVTLAVDEAPGEPDR